MPRGSKAAEGITIGFLGTGEMEADPATDLIEEFINEAIPTSEPAKFVFPLVSKEFSDSLAALADMARKSKIVYEVITTSEDKKRRAFQEAANGAAHTHLVTDVWTQMEQLLVDAPKSALFVLWDDKRDAELQDICFRFVDANVSVYDLTNGLARLSRDEGEEGEAPDGEEEEAEDEESVAAEADDEEPEEDEEEEATTVWTRAQLERKSHADVKDIAVGLGLPPRKARENMIQAILEKQGTAEGASEAPEEPQAAADGSVDTGAAQEFLEGLGGILEEFGNRFMTGLDEWLTKFSTAAEGFAFNTSPEEQMDVEEEKPQEEEQPRRRLVRR